MSPEIVSHIAQRYRVSENAVRELFRALQRTGGAQAQFHHPDLGGYGQWMSGMIMLSGSNDPQFKARISGLAAELAAMVEASNPMSASTMPESWWPADFGHPSAAGEQHGIRYAYFPDRERLLVQQGAAVFSYDTAGQHITGFAQQQSTSSRLCFTTVSGALQLAQLKCVPLNT